MRTSWRLERKILSTEELDAVILLKTSSIVSRSSSEHSSKPSITIKCVPGAPKFSCSKSLSASTSDRVPLISARIFTSRLPDRVSTVKYCRARHPRMVLVRRVVWLSYSQKKRLTPVWLGWQRKDKSSIIAAVRTVLPAPGMPDNQNKEESGSANQSMYSLDLLSQTPVFPQRLARSRRRGLIWSCFDSLSRRDLLRLSIQWWSA